MLSVVLKNKSFFVFLNKKLFIVQRVFFFSSLLLKLKKNHFWFLYIQKLLYRFGLRMPFKKSS